MKSLRRKVAPADCIIRQYMGGLMEMALDLAVDPADSKSDSMQEGRR